MITGLDIPAHLSYFLIESNEALDLCGSVSNLMEAGWEPVGNPIVLLQPHSDHGGQAQWTTFTYIQAVKRL